MATNIIEMGKSVFMDTYAQYPIVLANGEGRHVYDTDGNKYLDMVAGIAVNILGYKDPGLTETLGKVVADGCCCIVLICTGIPMRCRPLFGCHA